MNEIIRIENLTHTYGEGTPFRRSAVENLSLDIYHGEFLGLIGHTGSGKSTLIQHLNGLLSRRAAACCSTARTSGPTRKKIRSVRFRVGLVFQYPEYQLFEETVYRDIAFGPTNMGLTGAELDRRVHDAAHFAGLDEGLLQSRPSRSLAGRSAASPSRA
ncbi:MAG: ATP-binding cassette domain-containing protein [Oscillospiraceae bacterium]